MKLSEAIRLGAMWKPQAFGGLRVGEATCAMGAAFDAAKLPMRPPSLFDTGPPLRSLPGKAMAVEVPLEWYRILAPARPCPACQPRQRLDLTYRLIAHLNDDHRWTREAIADHVERWEIEDAQASALRGDREAAPVAVGCGVTE